MKNSLKNWEINMYSALRIAMNQSKYDILNLYLKLEKASKKFFEINEMTEGDTFTIPLEDGSFLEHKFYKDCTTVDLINPDKTIKSAITREDSYKKEYSFLDGYTQALKNSEMGIGPHYPEELKEFLKNIKVGEVLVFDNGKSFVCSLNDGEQLNLIQTSNNTKVPHISEINKSKSYSVILSNKLSLQHFYSAVRDNYNDDLRCRITTTNKAQELINRCYAGLDKKTKKIKIGPNEFKVKKSINSNKMKWYDNNGNKIEEEKVKLLLGWLDIVPVITEFKREETDPQNEFNDNIIREEINKLFAGKYFMDAADMLSKYCVANNQELSINLSSYIDNNGNYEATTFVFRSDNNNCRIFKLSYADNDFTKDPNQIEEVDEADFYEFCEQKFDERFIMIENDIKKEILKNYPQYKGKLFEKIIHDLAEKEAKRQKIFNINIEKSREDISNLTKSMLEKEEDEIER